METFIAILRGINVGGKNQIKMAGLREVLASQGWKNLQTYIQSGNIVFQADQQDPMHVAARIGRCIKEQYGYQVPVLVLTGSRLHEIMKANPFGIGDSGKLHITFLETSPDQGLVKLLPKSPNPREAYLVREDAVYVYCPDGYGRTKINNNFFEKALRVRATTRNWKTCNQLLEMAKSITGSS